MDYNHEHEHEHQLLASLVQSINDLSKRVVSLEEAINKGRGAFSMFLVLLTFIGTIIGAIKLWER